MSQATFAVALAAAYANNAGELKTNPNSLASNATLVYVGNTKLSVDDNSFYLNTTQGSYNTTGAVTNATSNGICYYTVAPNGLTENFGQANANTTATVSYFAKPFSSNALGWSLSSNAVAAIAAVTTVNSTAFTLVSNTTANTLVSFWFKGL